jgi:hypothetical protein
MAIKVTIPSSSVSARTPKVVTSTSRVITATNLEGLANVDLTGAQDGYTFTFDADTNKWVASPVSSLAIDSSQVSNLDGGTY